MPFLKGNKYFESEMGLSGKNGFSIVALGAFLLGVNVGWNYPPFQQNIITALGVGVGFAVLAYYGLPFFKKKFIDEIGIYFRGDTTITTNRQFSGVVTLSPRIPLENASLLIELKGFLTGKDNREGVLQIFQEEKEIKKISTPAGCKKEIPISFIISHQEFEAWRENWVNKSPLGGKAGLIGWFGNFYTNTPQAYIFELHVTLENNRPYLPEAFRLNFSPK